MAKEGLQTPTLSGPLRVAHVGCGVWGSNLVRELKNHPDVELVLIVDPNPAAQQRAITLAPEAILASSVEAIADHGIDAVVVASPGPLHASHGLVALAAGTHVFLEKPMATSSSDARKLLSALRLRGRVGMVGHLLHYHRAVRSMFALVREGRIGVPFAFRSARLCLRDSRDVDGSLLWSLVPHDISVLRALDPSPVRHMTTALRTLGLASIPNVADLQIRLASGFQARIVASRAHTRKVRRMEVIGEEATLVFDDLARESKLMLRYGGGMEPVPVEGDETPLRAEVEAFVRCIRTGAVPEVGFSEGLAVVSLIERAQGLVSQGREESALTVLS